MTILWCCHVRGPDDVIPAKSYKDALKMADEINAKDFQIAIAHNPPELLTRAVPAIWPWSAEVHEEYLRKAATAADAGEHDGHIQKE